MERVLVGIDRAATRGALRCGAARSAGSCCVGDGWPARAAAAGGCSPTAKSELSPMEDRGVILATVNAPDGATLDYTARYLRRDRAASASSYPEFDRVFVVVGNPTVSQASVVPAHRRLGASASAPPWSWRASCSRKFNALPGVTAFPITPPSLGQGFRERPINFVILTSRQLREPDARGAARSSTRWPRTPASCSPTPTCG